MKKKKLFILASAFLTFTLSSCGSINFGNNPNIDDTNQDEKITLNQNEVTLKAGETFQVEYTITPSDAIEQEVAYEIGNPQICSVSDEGVITANNLNGTTNVTVYLKDRPIVNSVIKVTTEKIVKVSSITCSVDSFVFHEKDESISFNVSVLPINATDKTYDIYIEDPSIASLSEDKNSVVPLANGSTNLVIKANEEGSSVETKVPIEVNLDYYKNKEVSEELSPTKYFTYKDLVGTSNQDILPSIASEEDPEKVLVLPVEFTDITFDDVFGTNDGENKIVNDLEACFNGEVKDTNYWESVSSYFEKSSFGKLNFDFDIAEPVSSNVSTASILDGTESVGSAVQNAFYNFKNGEGADQDLTVYDKDTDGLFDSVWLIYSAPNYQTNPSYEDKAGSFWAFVTCFTTFLPNLNNPGICTFGWASYDFMYKKGEDKIDAHTYIHETGHLMGLNDYYDYTSQNSPLGGYDMQDWNVGDHNVWTKAALGRINPIIVETSKDLPLKIHLKPREEGGAIFITDNYNNTAFDEFIVLELYTPNGLNELDSTYNYDYQGKMPSKSGIKIYHVDSRLVQADENGYATYTDLSSLKTDGFDNTVYKTIGASNTHSYDRNLTAELFNQIELISSEKDSLYYSYQNMQIPYTSEDLFESGDTFDMNSFKYFTYRNYGKFNNGTSLNMKLTFKNVSEEGADVYIDYLY